MVATLGFHAFSEVCLRRVTEPCKKQNKSIHGQKQKDKYNSKNSKTQNDCPNKEKGTSRLALSKDADIKRGIMSSVGCDF